MSTLGAKGGLLSRRGGGVGVSTLAPVFKGGFAPPDGEVGIPYSYDLSALFSGTVESYVVYNGALSNGLTLNAVSGILSGTPTGTLSIPSFSVAALNAHGGAISNANNFAVAESTINTIKIATFGDSRADFIGVSPEFDYSATGYQIDSNATGTCQGGVWAALLLGDAELVGNGGASGNTTTTWNSTTRSNGKTIAAVDATNPDVILIQYGTNDCQGMGLASQADATATQIYNNTTALITEWLNRGKKVVWETIIPRTETGWTGDITLDTGKQAASDSANAQLIAWCTGRANVAIADTRSLFGISGSTTGFMDPATPYSNDGVHLNWWGALAAGNILAAAVRGLFPSRGRMLGMRGTVQLNLLGTSITGKALNSTPSGATISSPTYGEDADGLKYVEWTVTPTTTAASVRLELHSSVGGVSPEFPVVAGDKIKMRHRVTIDDGVGGIPNIRNVRFRATCINKTSSTRATSFGEASAEGGDIPLAIVDALVSYPQFELHSGSDNLDAPTLGGGLFIEISLYSQIADIPFRIRITDPQINKML